MLLLCFHASATAQLQGPAYWKTGTENLLAATLTVAFSSSQSRYASQCLQHKFSARMQTFNVANVSCPCQCVFSLAKV